MSKPIIISELENNENLKHSFKDNVFFKERWINENGIEQKLIVSFSFNVCCKAKLFLTERRKATKMKIPMTHRIYFLK